PMTCTASRARRVLLSFPTRRSSDLPHEPGVQVRDRPVPVVDVGERGALPELAVLPRAGARDDVAIAVPARRLPGRRQLATPSAARAEEQGKAEEDRDERSHARRDPAQERRTG